MAKKTRLDQLLVERGLAESRSKAQALIMAGEVRVGGVQRTKPGEMVVSEAEVVLLGGLPYVSRGGYKLAHALDAFGLNPAGLVAMDVGSSTGGFTDVLLQHGALRVYAVDVGYGLLDWKLRQDARVVVLERTNIRYLEQLPYVAETGTAAVGVADAQAQHPTAPDCATIDVAFISLKLVLPPVQQLIKPDAWIVALIKPQFEAGSAEVDRGAGVIRDPEIHAQVLREIVEFARRIGLTPHGLARSPITGPAGNVEFLAWFAGPGPELDLEQSIVQVLAG